MGVLNKLKGRMTGRNALTKGPGKHHGPSHCDVDYMHTKYWDDMRKRNAPGPGKEWEFDIGERNKSYTSGVDAVSAGLSAAANEPQIEYEDIGGQIAEAMGNIGEALAKAPKSNRKKELDKIQKDNPDMSRGDARKKRRKIKKMDKANEKAKRKSKKVEDKINKGKTKGKDIYYNSSEDTFRLE